MINLTIDEQEEVINYLKSGKSLPDKYRFLLFENKNTVEILWNGKTNKICDIAFPFNLVEYFAGYTKEIKKTEYLIDYQGNIPWTNKLICADNKFVLSSLKNGAMRKIIEAQGGIKLIYIDPPFDIGINFSIDICIGDKLVKRSRNNLEEIAYRDRWGLDSESFLNMIYERLILMHDLLADDGTIYVHCNNKLSSYLKLVLDDIFGEDNCLNEIIWVYDGPQSPNKIKFAKKHDTIYRYAKSIQNISPNEMYYVELENFDPKKYKLDENNNYYYTIPPGDYTQKRLKELDKDGLIIYSGTGNPRIKKYVTLSEDKKYFQRTKKISDVWNITSLGLAAISKENCGYPTQKPEALLQRIIKASSKPGDLVADFFCGSGTLAAVAEKLGRKWIAVDIGKFAIHTAKKRLRDVQRDLKEAGQDYQAFEVLDLWPSEGFHFIGLDSKRSADENIRCLEEFKTLILSLYKAEHLSGFATLHGQVNGKVISICPIDQVASKTYLENIINECQKNNFTNVDVLAFEFAEDLFPAILSEAKPKGINITPKYIPREVFDKRARSKNKLTFFNVANIEAKPIYNVKNKLSVAIELQNYYLFYSKNPVEYLERLLKHRSSQVFIEYGQVVKVIKTKDGQETKEILTKKWSDWIDYWSVDFNFRSSKCLLARNYPKEIYTDNNIFESEWQSFRTKQKRDLKLVSRPYTYILPGTYQVAIKVVDIFNNETMKIISVNVEE